MSVSLEKQALRISQKLGEPDVFFEWRKNLLFHVLNEKKQNPVCDLRAKANSSILGIRKKDVTKRSSPVYTNDHNSTVRVIPWASAINDIVLQKSILEIFNKTSRFLTENICITQNIALFSDGMVIVCPAGSHGSVSLRTVIRDNSQDVIFVLAEKGAELSIYDDVQYGDNSTGRMVVIMAHEHASVEYIHATDGAGIMHNNTISFAKADSSITFFDMNITSGVSKANIQQCLEGENARSEIRSILISKGSGIVDVSHNAHHLSDKTQSSIYSSGVTADNAKTVYRSNIIVKKESVKNIIGEQNAKFITLSPHAKINVLPALSIAQKDITCSHSVSISHLKDSDTYYPRLRGLEKDSAAKLIVEGLLGSQINNLRNLSYKKTLQEKIEKETQTISL